MVSVLGSKNIKIMGRYIRIYYSNKTTVKNKIKKKKVVRKT